MLVVASTNGQNGELKAARSSGWRASPSSRRLVPYLNANRLEKVIGSGINRVECLVRRRTKGQRLAGPDRDRHQVIVGPYLGDALRTREMVQVLVEDSLQV